MIELSTDQARSAVTSPNHNVTRVLVISMLLAALVMLGAMFAF